MINYLSLMVDVLKNGWSKSDRTGTGTISTFGRQMRFDLKKGFPIPTTCKKSLKSIVAELIWFLEGSTDNNRLNELGAKIWDEWALPNGDLGPIYGKQWVAWDDHKVISPEDRTKYEDMDYVMISNLDNGDILMYRRINQISNVIEGLRENPMSRRHVVTSWNPADAPIERRWAVDPTESVGAPPVRVKVSPQENVELGKAALAACHTLFQFNCRELSVEERMVALSEDKRSLLELTPNMTPEETRAELLDILDHLEAPKHALSCQVYLRSQDVPLGTPYNIASYAILTHMIAQVTNMVPDELIWVGGDVHIYKNQVAGVKEQLVRNTRNLPKLVIKRPEVRNIFDFKVDDFELEGYNPHPLIQFPISV
ncbi:MAG: thymidylate synthase [Gammaproteobacteria bacterium]|nr:thymidylate synthase [Gammaproteobacteria bacterium]